MATQNVTQMTGVRLKNGRCTSDEYEVALVVSMCNISGFLIYIGIERMKITLGVTREGGVLL